MKTLIISALVLAAGAQAREPENLAALVDEMAVLERVIGAALQSEMSGLVESRYDLQALHRQTGMQLERWLQERVRNIEAEYLVRQGIMISLQFSHRRSAHDLPDSLFTTLARTAETRWSGLVASLEPDDFTELKRLVDQQDQTREKHEELRGEGEIKRLRTQASGEVLRPEEDPGIREMGAVVAREREQQTAIDAEIQRLRGLLAETTPEVSTDDIHGALIQVVCDYAMLKSLPDDEYLTLKLSRLTSPREESRTGTRWTYYVLTKRDVVECRRGSIDAAELRQRADVYSLPRD